MLVCQPQVKEAGNVSKEVGKCIKDCLSSISFGDSSKFVDLTLNLLQQSTDSRKEVKPDISVSKLGLRAAKADSEPKKPSGKANPPIQAPKQLLSIPENAPISPKSTPKRLVIQITPKKGENEPETTPR